MPTAYFFDGASPPLKYTATNSDYSPQSSSVTTVTARLASNGNRPMEVVSLRGYISSANTTNKTVSMSLSGNVSGTTGSFTVAPAGSASSTGTKTMSTNTKYSTTPATATLSITTNGIIYIGNNDGGGTSNVIKRSDGTNLATNRTIWAEYGYYEVPVTPTIGTVTADAANQRLGVSWTGISDWGGGTVGGKGYLVRISTSNAVDSNGNFTSTFATKSVDDTTVSTIIDIAGNTGATYYAQVYAYNQLSSFSGGPKSVPSATKSVYLGPAAAAPTWSDSMPDTARVGVLYSGTATASSSTTLTLSTPINTLSTYGLSVTKSGNTYTGAGTNLGRPTKSGTATLTMRATDTYNQTTDLVNNITVSAPYTPSMASSSFADGTANQSYTTQTIYANYASSMTASWAGASPGLSISTSSATSSNYAKIVLSGTPSSNAGGTYYINVSLTGFQDGTSTAPTASSTMSVYINPLPVPTWVDTTIDTIAAVGQPYSSNVSASNTTSYSLIGAPSWLSISSSGTLSGTPTHSNITYGQSAEAKAFIIRANGETESIEQEFSIDVVHPTKIYKDAYGDFVYPETRFQRYDSTLGFTTVQWVRRRNATNTGWEDIDLV